MLEQVTVDELAPDVRVILERIAAPFEHKAAAVVVGVVTPAGSSALVRGLVDWPGSPPPDAGTWFEIGSITKVFTAILLARAVRDGTVGLDQPIGEVDADFAGLPSWITPRALATHTSGLPRIPVPWWRLLSVDLNDPYAQFSEDDLVRWMSRWRPRRRPARRPSYSNLGVGLLGVVLGRLHGGGYEAALTERVLAPLGLDEVAVTPIDDVGGRLAQPHTGRGRATPPWRFDALAGCGALAASTQGLAGFAHAVITAAADATAATTTAAPVPVPAADSAGAADEVRAAIVDTLQPQVLATGATPGPDPDGQAPKAAQCLGWSRIAVAGQRDPIFWHNGGTAGSLAELHAVPAAGIAVSVLSNCGYTPGRDARISRSEQSRLVVDLVAALQSKPA